MIESRIQPPYSTAKSGTAGLVFDIKRYALHDGPGIRTTVFLKGCALRCWWCHNPESQLPNAQIQKKQLPLENTCLTEEVTLGREMSANEIFAEIERDRVFYDESGGGVTFSGGEPLLQADFLKDLLIESGRRGIHRALDTCGYAPEAVVAAVAPHSDLFLFDLKLMDEDAHKRYTGVSNRLILANLDSLLQLDAQIVIRFPLIPGITDTQGNLQSLRSFMNDRPALSRIDILPYHRSAKSKYERLGREDHLRGVPTPSDQDLMEMRDFFQNSSRIVRIGG